MPKFQNREFENEDYAKINFMQSKTEIVSDDIEKYVENEVIAWQEIIKLTDRDILH